MFSPQNLARRALLLVVVLVGCGSEPSPTPALRCLPGASVACVGVGGCMGGQICNAAGTGVGFCDCGTPFDGGPIDGGRVDMSFDAAAIDLGPGDAGLPGECSPLTQAGCGPSERCTWVSLGLDVGVLRCVPSGTVVEGGACTTGPEGDLGYDDCARGLYCTEGTCGTVCELADPASCGADYCTSYAGVFANEPAEPVVGVCAGACDPVTQLQSDGTSCPIGEGCYQIGPRFVCAGVTPTSTLTHGQRIVGAAYANSCAPGYTPGPSADGLGSICMAHCRPLDTSSESPAGAAGAPPHACTNRGAASPPNECRFFPSRAYPDSADPRLDAVGVCFDRTGRTYDDDGDPTTAEVPIPSCTTLSAADSDGDGVADNVPLGCAPQPMP